jgi:hypothetical protein
LSAERDVVHAVGGDGEAEIAADGAVLEGHGVLSGDARVIVL